MRLTLLNVSVIAGALALYLTNLLTIPAEGDLT